MADAQGAKFKIGMVIFDDMTNLDMVGPADTLSRVRSVELTLIGRTRDPVRTDSGYRVVPDLTMEEAPQLDMLFIGGGGGTTGLMEDAETLDFLRAQAAGAKLVTSVCTGALVLGAAGLLRGYRAATHWTAMELLPILGAIPVHERVVVDRNRITGGGVTASIDFGLRVVAEQWGDEQAQLIQLGSEYAPEPPFDAGSPRTAPKAIVDRFLSLTGPRQQARRAAAERAAARF